MFLQKIALSLLSVVIMAFLNSCEVINPDEKVPSYLHIDHFTLTTNSDQGTASENITDAWLYVDDQPLGCYELPATIPILAEGNHKVTIKPGIKVNGISGTRAIYPFYTHYSGDLNLLPDSILTINPAITYSTSAVFIWKEAFEDGGLTLETTAFSDTTIEKTSDPAFLFEGNYSGIINLDANHPIFEATSINDFYLPNGDSPVFLEMNFKTECGVYIGLFANNSTTSNEVGILTLNKSSTWKKIYINLKNAINNSSDATSFQVFFHVEKTDEVSNPSILVDNIKLIYL